MTDIVEALQERGDILLNTINPVGAKLCFDAASEIAALRSENEALREHVRMFLATFALDTEDDCAQVASALEIESHSGLWELAQQAHAALQSPPLKEKDDV